MAVIGDGDMSCGGYPRPYWSVIPPYCPQEPVYIPTVFWPDVLTSDHTSTTTTWAATDVINPATKIARAFEARRMGQIMRRDYRRLRSQRDGQELGRNDSYGRAGAGVPGLDQCDRGAG